MTGATLILKNVTRNKRRTILTVLAIALPMFVFTIARSFVDLVDYILTQSDRNLRIAVHQKLTYVTYMPQRIRGEIESFAPAGYVTAICRTSWFGGKIEGVQSNFASFGVDRDTFPIVYSDYKMTPEDVERFNSERRAAVVGKPLANEMNWKVGDRVTLKGGVPPFPELEFVIVAIPDGMIRPWFCFGLDYYNEVYQQAMGDSVGINNFWVKCSTPQARQWALTEIDKHFSNTDYETRTEMESTFIAAFMRSGGDWVGMVWAVGQLIVLVALAVAFNTMSMAFRERTRELAVLRAVGFSAGRIVRMVLCEGFLLGLLGGMVAVLPVYLVTANVAITIPQINIPVVVSPFTLFVAVTVAMLCGLLAAVVPALMAGRLQVAATLRKVV